MRIKRHIFWPQIRLPYGKRLPPRTLLSTASVRGWYKVGFYGLERFPPYFAGFSYRPQEIVCPTNDLKMIMIWSICFYYVKE